MPDKIEKVSTACLNAAASLDPNLYWWEMFWTGAGVCTFVAGVIAIMILVVRS